MASDFVYGENGVLADSILKEIPASDKASMVVLNAEKNVESVRKIRTFLWDSTTGMKPLSASVTTNGNAATWTDSWDVTGTAYADHEALVLDCAEGKSGSASLETEIETNYDISWDMSISQFGGAESISIKNGATNVMFQVKEDGISCNSSNEDVFLPWVINQAEHKYRIISKDSKALLYIDGFFVGEISSTVEGDGISKISFSNQGESSMRITNMFLGTFAESNIPMQGFYDDFEVDAGEWNLVNPTFNNGVTGEFWKVEDGCLRVDDEHIALDYTTYCVSNGTRKIPEIGDEFLIQTKIAFPSFGTRSYFMIIIDGRAFTLDMREKFFSMKPIADNSKGAIKSSDELSVMDSKDHILTFESYNYKQNVRVYLDGKLILDEASEAYSSKSNEIRIMTDGGFILPASLKFDFIKYAPKNYDVRLTAPANNASYDIGDDIAIAATEKVDFVLNGIDIANGTNLVLSDLPAGCYKLEARSGEKVSDCVMFTVKEEISANVNASLDNGNLSVSLEDVSDFEGITSVAYMLDGKRFAESKEYPYVASVSGVSAGNHFVEAVAYNQTGIEVGSFGCEVYEPIANTTNAYSYEVSYQATGTGSIDVKNGNHHLQIKHELGGFRYLTDKGEESYSSSGGEGTFNVLTDGPIAEVYRNGQFILSFYMPKTKEVGTEVSENITDHKIEIPQVRKSYFSAWNITDKKESFDLYNLDHNHNLDFVANASDEGHIALNDGYFRNDITLKDGKIYVWSVERNNSDPELVEVTKLSAEDVYYRVETSGGMSRLYADGRWVFTFRNPNVSGRKGTLAVQISKGDGLSYLGVNSNSDLYYYRDSFDGSGEIDSIDYWTTIGCDAEVDVNNSSLHVVSEQENTIAELNAYVGNATLDATIKVESGTEGVWFMSNHCVTRAFTKAGYNFKTNSYEIVQVDDDTETIVASKAGSFPVDTSVDVSLRCEENYDGKKVTFYVNGEKILSSADVIESRGTIGFVISNGGITIESVDFSGDAKPMLDVRSTVLVDAPNALDMIETDERTYLVTQGTKGYYTTNGGETWETFMPSANQGFGPSGYGGMSKNMAQLQNGEIVAMHRNAPATWTDAYGQRKSCYQAYVSTDGGQGMTWTKPGNANFPEKGQLSGAVVGRDATVNRVTQGPSGRIYFVFGEGNSEDYGDAIVWMSDDNGRNWFESNTRASALETGFVIAEAVIIETTKSTRMYFRTELGQLCYFESYDRGMTWDLTPHTTPFISSMTCFGLEADPDDPDTLYIGWGYDNINFFARAQFPRTRWSVAKSTDGGDSWEMVGTVHENTGVLTQAMNRSLNVSKDYIYLNGAAADKYRAQGQDGANRVVAFPKEKQRTSLRMEQLHLQDFTHIENAKLVSDEQNDLCMVVNFEDESVSVGDSLIEDAAEDGYVLLDVAAYFVGASSTQLGSDGSLILNIGGQEVIKYNCDVKNISGRNYVKLTSFANKLGLNLFETKGLVVVSMEDNWSRRQMNSICFRANVYSNQP